jgi:hypothetical protein
METHFKGPRGDYRCMHVTSHVREGWAVEKLFDNRVHVVSMNMTREDAFEHARTLSGLQDYSDVVVVDEPLPDRRGLVAHSRAKSWLP